MARPARLLQKRVRVGRRDDRSKTTHQSCILIFDTTGMTKARKNYAGTTKLVETLDEDVLGIEVQVEVSKLSQVLECG